MKTIENVLKIMRVKILVRVSVYFILIVFTFLFVAVKIDLSYGLVLMMVFLLTLFIFTIPAYKNRLNLGKKFCQDVMKSADGLSKLLQTVADSNRKGEVCFNIYSFDSKFNFIINGNFDNLEEIERECLTISNKCCELLKEYISRENAVGYVNFDSLLVGMITLLLLDQCIYRPRVSFRLSVQGYSESFSFTSDEKSDVVQNIKSALIYQSL